MKDVKSVENRLKELISQNNLGEVLTMDMIKDWIWREEGEKSFGEFTKKVTSYFKNIKDINELNIMMQVFSDAWNYFPHRMLGGLSPAQKMLEYEKRDNQAKRKAPLKHQKLTKKQKDLLWSSGGEGPYSQANLIKQVRILEGSVSRVFLVVEAEINPTTFEIVNKNRHSDEFKNDIMIQQLLDKAEYRGPQFGYVVATFEEEYARNEVMIRAEHALKYVQETIIKMHKYVMDNFSKIL